MLNLCPEKFNAVNCVEPRLCQQYGNLNTLFHYEFEKLSDDVQWYKGMLKSLTFFLDSQFVYNHVLVGGRNHVFRSVWNHDEFLTSEEELSEHDAEDQDDESCIDVGGR